MTGEFLPAGIADGGKGNEVLGQIQLPQIVLGDKVVVGHRGGTLGSSALRHRLGGGHILPAGILGESVADGFLKIRGFHIIDSQDGGEAQLADHLVHRRIGVMGSGTVRKQHIKCSFVNSDAIIVAVLRQKVNRTGNTIKGRNGDSRWS